MSKSKIPGLSFSWKRALGITKMKRKISKATWYVLGCGKDNPCKDYEPTDITPEKAEAIREALNIQWQYN